MAEITPAPAKPPALKRKFTLRIQKDKCKSCQLCIVACPCKLLEFSKTLNKKGVVFVRVKEKGDCSGCKSCVLICPDNCITIVEETL
jgi:2-oxoglutarate ferredoxin oxidoreductase subunit delta